MAKPVRLLRSPPRVRGHASVYVVCLLCGAREKVAEDHDEPMGFTFPGAKP